jgi:hypothetical protein
MIRIFKLVLLLVVSQVAFGQAPTNYTNINGRYRWIAGMFDSTFHIPKGTTPSLRTGGSTNAGAVFYNTSDSSVYTYTGTQWIKLRGVVIDTTSLSNRINLKLNISDTSSMLAPYLRKIDTASLSNRINLKLNISDTATMLGNYLNNVGYGLIKSGQVVRADSATLATYFLRRKDSLTTTNPLGYVTRKILADTAAAIRSADAGGSVTSVATNNGTGITGGTITTSGTLAIDTLTISTKAWRQKGVDSLQANINQKLNISDTALMLNPYLRKIDTASLSNRINLKLNISDTATMLNPYLRKIDTTNKYVTQVYKKNASDSVFYVKGGNHLWAFNDSTGNAGGGGGGKIYYFNGGVSMGTFGGFTMYELGDTANTGAAANFTRATTGNIANFITDPGKPGLLQIPAGVWTIDAWLSETGGGSNHAQIYAQVEKWDGSTITTIATSPIEQITEGSSPNLYTWSVSIPTTTLAVTDRIIIQFYIQNTNGKTVTLYTQNNYVGEVHTTFTTGIGAINGLTAPAQYLVTGTSGTDFNISSVTATHTFNLPTASATNRGALSSADWTAFNNKGSVSSVATNNATGITGGTITTTGTIAIDTTVISTRLWRQKGIDSVQSNLTAGLALKVNISDTSSMLLPYLRKIDTASLSNRINLKVNISDTASMLSPYLRAIDTASLSNRLNLKVNISDTSSMLNPYLRKADTTSMLANYVNAAGYGLSKAGQVLSADSATLASYFLRRKDSLTATNLLGYVTRTVLADSAAAIRAAAGAGTVTGSGTATEVAFWNGTSSLSSSSNLYWDNANSRLGINNSTPSYPLTVNGSVMSTAENAYYWTKPSSPSSDIYSLSANSSGAYIYNHTTANTLAFFAEGGNVGIGTVTPDSMLTVTNGARFERGVRMSGLPTGVGTKAVRIDANGTLSVADTTTGGISGSGTTNRLAKFTASGTIGNGSIADSSSSVAMTISSAGNVGIGTTSPSNLLTIAGANGAAYLRVNATDATLTAKMQARSAVSAIEMGAVSNSPLILVTNDTERMRITSAGLVQIGPNAATVALDVNGSGNVTIAAKSSDNFPLLQLRDNRSTDFEWNIENGRVASGVLGLFYATGNATRVAFEGATGNVGIGTTTIGSRLQVNGNAAIGYSASTAAPTNGLQVAGQTLLFDDLTLRQADANTTSYFASPRILIQNTSATVGNFANLSFVAANGDDAAAIWTILSAHTLGAATGQLVFGTTNAGASSTERMRITSTGNVGIGTTSPAYKLDVSGSGRFTNTLYGVGAEFSGTVYTDILQNYTGGTTPLTIKTGGAQSVKIQTNSTDRVTIASTGAATFSASQADTGGIIGALNVTNNTSGNVINAILPSVTSADAIFYRAQTVGAGANNKYFFVGQTGNGSAITTNNVLITTNGAATFASSVTATNYITGGVANTASFAATGYSLTGSNASSLIDLAGTWNTTGNPTAIKLNITNTASGATSNLMDLQVGGTSQYKVDKAGNSVQTGTIKTTAGNAWNLKQGGVAVGGADGLSVLVDIDGTTYYLLTGYPPEPEPEATSGPSIGYKAKFEQPAIKIKSDNQKIKDLEKEIAQLKELIKSKIK